MKNFTDEFETVESFCNYLINVKDKYIFRGCTNKAFDLKPSLYRQVKEDYDNGDELIKIEEYHKDLFEILTYMIESQVTEDNLEEHIKNIIEKYPNFKDYYNNLKKLITHFSYGETKHDRFVCYYLAQHYGFKTKLLDFSESPIVALIFACEDWNKELSNNENEEGIIYLVSKDKYKNITYEDFEAFDTLLAECGEEVYEIEERYYDGKVKYVDGQNVALILADDEYELLRQKRQKGCFLLFPKFVSNIFKLENEICDEIYLISPNDKKEILEYIENKYKKTMKYLKGEDIKCKKCNRNSYS